MLLRCYLSFPPSHNSQYQYCWMPILFYLLRLGNILVVCKLNSSFVHLDMANDYDYFQHKLYQEVNFSRVFQKLSYNKT